MPKIATARAIPDDIALVVFGTDQAKKCHASRFSAGHAVKAMAAAEAMGMRAVPVVNDAQRLVASKFPKGKLTATGRTVVPFVRPALFEKFLAVAGPANDSAPVAPTGSSPTPTSNHNDGEWSKIKNGSIVLATENVAEGVFECVVQDRQGDVLILTWRLWPDFPKYRGP